MLVVNDESDFDALRFDNLMYGYMVALCQACKVEPYGKRVAMMAQCLSSLVTVPQVKERLPFIERVADGRMLDGADRLRWKTCALKLRSLIKFIVKGPRHRDVVTHLDDPVTQITSTASLRTSAKTSRDYKLKVERYLKDYGNNLVIHKLRTNKPMTEYEFGQLERIFTHELGNAEDYARAYGDTPFGLWYARLPILTEMRQWKRSRAFLNDQSLNEQQISFIKRVVDYVVENGYMEPTVLNQPPFDRPCSFVKIFSTQQQMDLVGVIKSIKENAVIPAA